MGMASKNFACTFHNNLRNPLDICHWVDSQQRVSVAKICVVCKSACTYVTGFWKTLRMGFFVKIEFDVSLISSTIELTHLQV